MRRVAFSNRWRRSLGGALVVVGAGAIVWAMSADAGPSHEPAALARHAVLTAAPVGASSRLETSRPFLDAGDLVADHGTKRVHLGGDDEVIAALTGSLVPVAVQSNDGSMVAYASWHQVARVEPGKPGQGLNVGDPIGVPSVRLYDMATDKDKLVAAGAYSPALSKNGELAFVKGENTVVRENRDYVGQVVAGAARNGHLTQWTSDAARYFTYAWAGRALLVYRSQPDSEATDLYVFSGPRDDRLLAADATVTALSPDGSRVLVTVGRRMVEVVRLADGAVESSLALDGPGVAAPGSTSTPHALMYSGSWLGDRVVANSDAGLVVLNVKDGLRIESVFKTHFPHGIIEPTLTDDTHIIGWADLAPVSTGTNAEPAYDHALVDCDLVSLSCAVGPSRPARAWTRWIGNPSR